MAIQLTQQASTFFYSLLLGVVLGCLYDFFRITRLAFVVPALLVLLEDLLFFLFSSIILFGFMLDRNYGQIRYFILLGVLLGWTVYYFTVGELVMRCSTMIIQAMKALFALIWRPFGWLGGKISAAMKKLRSRIAKTMGGAKFNLKLRVLMMYNKKNKGQGGGKKNEQQDQGESIP